MPSTFIKAPKRKPEKARFVTVSDEAKKAYEELMQRRDAEQEAYRRFLDPGSRRA